MRLLRRLADIAEHVIVGCSTDEFNALKGKETVVAYADRAEVLMACRYVSQVFPEQNWDQKSSDIPKYGADVFAMGDDWEGQFDTLNAHCDVMYLPRTEGVSSSILKVRAKSLGTIIT